MKTLITRTLITGALLFATSAFAAGALSEPERAPDKLDGVRAQIAAKNFPGAIDELKRVNDAGNADWNNLMGFSLRKTGDYKQAYTFYRKALDFDPDHKGALEYLGELYVETGQVEKARENVVLLKKLCPGGCEELADLEHAIASAKVN